METVEERIERYIALFTSYDKGILSFEELNTALVAFHNEAEEARNAYKEYQKTRGSVNLYLSILVDRQVVISSFNGRYRDECLPVVIPLLKGRIEATDLYTKLTLELYQHKEARRCREIEQIERQLVTYHQIINKLERELSNLKNVGPY